MIELIRVSKAYGDKQVLNGVSLRFEAGKHYALLGPSGCGKTTLLRIIAGLETPDSGEVRRDASLPLSFCFQEDRLLPWYTVAENIILALPQELQRDRARARRAAEAWLERVGLAGEADSLPASLSGGMKRRASLARALAYDAPVLLMDEPFRALDDESHAATLALVRALSQGRTLILVTHDEQDAQGMEIIRL